MPETTRRPLIEVARALRHRRLRVRPPRLRRAPDRLARLDRLPRQPRLGDPAPGHDRARARPRAAGLDRGACRASATRRSTRTCASCACASRTRRRSPRCTGAACPTRRTRRRRSARRRRAPRRRATGPTGAARCSRSARRCGSTRAPGSSGCCATPTSTRRIYVGDDRTDLDAFRGLDELVDMGRAAAPRSRRRALRRGAARARARGRRDGRRHRGVRELLQALADVAADAVRRLPQGDGAARAPGAATLLAALTIARRRAHRRAGGHADRGRLVGDRGASSAHGSAATHATSPPIARLLADARLQTTLPEPRPGLDAAQPAVAAARWSTIVAAALVVLHPAGRRRSRPASRSSGRSPGGARTPR